MTIRHDVSSSRRHSETDRYQRHCSLQSATCERAPATAPPMWQQDQSQRTLHHATNVEQRWAGWTEKKHKRDKLGASIGLSKNPDQGAVDGWIRRPSAWGSQPWHTLPRFVTAAELKLGQTGVVGRVCAEGAVRVRLLEMGLVPGTRMHLVRKAPMGDPFQFEVRGYNLSLRRDEAAWVELEVTP